MHCIWTLPEGDSNYSGRWSMIKSGFSMRTKKNLHKPEWINASRQKYRETTIWQRRFWEHLIRDDEDYRIHMDYIHYNPVKHELVKQVKNWPYSTFHRYVKKGIYSENWGNKVIESLSCRILVVPVEVQRIQPYFFVNRQDVKIKHFWK